MVVYRVILTQKVVAFLVNAFIPERSQGLRKSVPLAAMHLRNLQVNLFDQTRVSKCNVNMKKNIAKWKKIHAQADHYTGQADCGSKSVQQVVELWPGG